MLTVYKFGGSILKNANDIKKISKIILENKINVFSALFSITDQLILSVKNAENKINYRLNIKNIEEIHIKICEELEVNHNFIQELFADIIKLLDTINSTGECSLKTIDNIISNGEFLSSKIVYEYIKTQNKNLNINFVDTRNCIKTNSDFGNAKVNLDKTTRLIKESINLDKINIITGFISSDDENNITTLGRNGSDYSAALIGAILKCKEIVIWKDVDGVFTANPKIVKNAIQIDSISYQEMSELAHFGNKVIALQALTPATDSKIPIRIRSLYNHQNIGTIISHKTNDKFTIKGIVNIENICLINIQINNKHDLNLHDFIKELFTIIDKINIPFVTNNAEINSVCIACYAKNAKDMKSKIENHFKAILENKIININDSKNHSIVSIVNSKISNKSEIINLISNELKEAKININTFNIKSLDANISFIVDSQNTNEAINLIHKSIFTPE